MKAIGIDLGGTRIKSVLIDHEGHVLHEVYATTDDSETAGWKSTVAQLVAGAQFRSGAEPINVGIAAPGLPAADLRSIAFMPGRMNGLENFDWPGYLGKNTCVINDAVAALMAEAAFGIAKSRKHVVMITLGTGVGGAILIDGKPYLGAFNKAGHIGHMVIDENGDADVTGMPGSLEECIGNCTIEKRSNGKFRSTKEMLTAFHDGDEWAKQVWTSSVKRLALGLASITNILSPEMIVLGGGITEAGDLLFEPLTHFMDMYEWTAGNNRVEIVKATYGDLAGAVGAARMAMG